MESKACFRPTMFKSLQMKTIRQLPPSLPQPRRSGLHLHSKSGPSQTSLPLPRNGVLPNPIPTHGTRLHSLPPRKSGVQILPQEEEEEESGRQLRLREAERRSLCPHLPTCRSLTQLLRLRLLLRLLLRLQRAG